MLGLCQLLEHHVAVVEQAQQAVTPLLQPQELSPEGEAASNASRQNLPVHCELPQAMEKMWAVLLQHAAWLHLTSKAAQHLVAATSCTSPDAPSQPVPLQRRLWPQPCPRRSCWSALGRGRCWPTAQPLVPLKWGPCGPRCMCWLPTWRLCRAARCSSLLQVSWPLVAEMDRLLPVSYRKHCECWEVSYLFPPPVRIPAARALSTCTTPSKDLLPVISPLLVCGHDDESSVVAFC